MGRVLSGIQPTGALHLGNYLGAITQWVRLQDQHECLFCIVDLHAMTVAQDPADLHRWTRQMAAAYIACGLDPERCIIFPQSWVPGHTQLSWLLSCLTPLGWLNRMTQFKEKAGKERESAGLGLYAYPVLMAADILLYKATHVPVGEDQKQHLELSRDIAGTFHRRFNKSFFPLPEPLIMGPATRVMSLRDGTEKMSKSDPHPSSRIHLWDTEDDIIKKIRKAKTDAFPVEGTPEAMQERPEALNLLSILAALLGETLGGVCQRYAGAQFSVIKRDLSDCLIEHFTPMRRQYESLLENMDHLEGVLKKGAQKAQEISEPHMQEIHSLMGLGC